MPNQNFTVDSVITSLTTTPLSGFINPAFIHICNVKRRNNNLKDLLNAPDYGYTDNWDNVYINLPCRLEISNPSDIQFKETGERIKPTNILYVDFATPLKAEDRIYILNSDLVSLGYGTEFIVQGRIPALDMIRKPRHHLEYNLIVP